MIHQMNRDMPRLRLKRKGTSCSTSRLFYCLVLVFVFSIFSTYWLMNAEEEQGLSINTDANKDGHLKRVRRLGTISMSTSLHRSTSPHHNSEDKVSSYMDNTPYVNKKVVSNYNNRERLLESVNQSPFYKHNKQEQDIEIIGMSTQSVGMTDSEQAQQVTIETRKSSQPLIEREKGKDDTLENNEPETGEDRDEGGISDPRLNQRTSDTLYLVLILIHSAINQTQKRNTIRKTWLSSDMLGDTPVIYWFLIGGKDVSEEENVNLEQEQKRCNDLMILWDIKNDYYELTSRSLHSMVHIVNNYNFVYMLKTDDDYFLNTPVILSELNTIYPHKRFYWGRFSCHNPPMDGGRWDEKEWHWCDVYYPYAYGGMYVLSQDVVQLIVDNSNSLHHYSCEDVSVGAWLAPYNLYRVNDGRIYVQHGTRCSRGYIAIHIPHRLAYKIMKKFYDNLKRKGVLCTTLVKEGILLWEGLPHTCLNDTRVLV